MIKNKMKLFSLYLSLSLVLNIFYSSEIFSQTVKLKIIETTDVHGAVFPYDFSNNKEINNSLAQVMTYVKEQREIKGQEVILVSNGDIIQGTPVVYYYNFEKQDETHLYAKVMNYMKYDAGTVGNHDIETGHTVYDKFKSELNFPWLAANALDTKTGHPYFQPYFIIERMGIKIAVFGLITPGIPNWLPEKIWKGIEFEDMILSARKWVEIIEEKENPDLLIGLFHSGVDYKYDNQTADTPKNENASQLVAEQVPGFDIVFVGHDHQGWDTSFVNTKGEEVLLLGASSSARDVSVADILMTFDEKTNRWNKELLGEIINMKDYKPDEDFMKKFADGLEEVKNYVSKPIGEFTESISTRESLFGNSSFVDLIHSIQLDLTKADISFTAPLSFNTEINSGQVYVGDMFELYHYENLLYTMDLTGQEILDYLEYSYALWFNEMKSEDDNLLNFERDKKGNLVYSERYNAPELKARYYNFDSAAGIDYIVDVSKPVGKRVKIISLSNGEPFELRKIYKTAINSYRGNGGGGHLIDGAKIPKDKLTGRIFNSTEKDLRYYLMKWIEKNKIVTPKAFGNWKVVPDKWWAKGKEKDYILLYKK